MKKIVYITLGLLILIIHPQISKADHCGLYFYESCGNYTSQSCGGATNCYTTNNGNGTCFDTCTCATITLQGSSYTGWTTGTWPDGSHYCSPMYTGSACSVTGNSGGTLSFPSYSCSSGGGGGGGSCGDGMCNNGETSSSCSTDCPPINFTISVSPGTNSALPGEAKYYYLTVTPSNTASEGSYTFTNPIPGCPAGATCTYSGGNTASTGTDWNVAGDQITTPAYKTVIVTPTTTAPGTYTLTFSATKNNTSVTKSTTGYLVANAGVNNSSCLSITPSKTTVTTGESFTVSVNLKNIGTSVWSPNDTRLDVSGVNNYHVLVSPWSNGAGPWTTSRAMIPSNVNPGSSIVVSIPVTAPTTAGTYNYSTQMIQEGIQWFGAICNGGNITVTSAPPPPTNPAASCPAPGTSGTITWTLPSGYTQVLLRVQESGATGSNAACGGGSNQLCTGPYTGSSYSFNGSSAPAMVAGRTYSWWIHTYSAATGLYSTEAVGGSFTCVPTVTQYTLTVTKPIGGRIVTTDNNISCGTTCSRQYNQGSTVTLQAIPDTSYWRFVGWGGACSGQGTGNCTLTINSDITNVTAQFRPKSLLYQEF